MRFFGLSIWPSMRPLCIRHPHKPEEERGCQRNLDIKRQYRSGTLEGSEAPSDNRWFPPIARIQPSLTYRKICGIAIRVPISKYAPSDCRAIEVYQWMP